MMWTLGNREQRNEPALALARPWSLKTRVVARALVLALLFVASAVAGLAQTNVLAIYDALSIGPAADPLSQGWIKGSGTGGTSSGVSPDPDFGVNAWNIDDNTGSAIGANYRTNFSPAQHAAIGSNAWELRATLRLVQGYTGIESIFLQYDNAGSRWFYFLDVNAAGQLRWRVFNDGAGVAATLTLQTNHDGAYHEHLLVKEPTSASARFYFDGNLIGLVGPSAASLTPGVNWGAGSTAGDGSANFKQVSFVSRPASTNLPPEPPPTTLTLGRPFSHHAVLQRDVPCPVFGKDIPGTSVTLTFARQTITTIADTNGIWQATLAAMPMSQTPRTLTVTGSTNVTLTNIVVGDVWLISGQSNADFPLSSASGGAAAANAATNTLLRYLLLAESPITDARAWTAAEVARLNKNDYFTGNWQMSSPSTAGSVSAVGYFFARQIQTNKNIPVGLIDCSVGGTLAENWIPDSVLGANPRLRALRENYLDSDMVPAFNKTRLLQNLALWDTSGRPLPMPDHPYKPGVCWRFGIEPLAPFALRGVLWYQGESNADFYDPFDYDLMARWHSETFRILVEAWRSAWRREDLPFYFVQLPRLNRPSWPWFRESQLRCALTISNAAMAVAWEYGDSSNVHPNQKEPVANRLALIARAGSYGEPVESSGPIYRAHRLEGTNIVLEFDHAETGLMSKDGLPLRLFQVAGADRRFVDANATISGRSVLVSSPLIPKPAAVRYAWQPDGNINFYNTAGLPASPFRTDRWTTSNSPVRVACIGNSITFGFGLTDAGDAYPVQLQALLGPEYDVRNFGKSGATVTRDSVNGGTARGYIRQIEHTNVLAFHPDVVICNLGINDASTFADAYRPNLVRDYREIIAAYRALPSAPGFILWSRLAPLFPGQTYYGQAVVTNVNDLIRQVADLTGADTLDMFPALVDHPEWFPDKLHPNATGARRVAEVTYGFLLQNFEIPVGTRLGSVEVRRSPDCQVMLSFSAVGNLAYTVQTSPVAIGTGWSDAKLFDAFPAPRILSWTNPATDDARFFRVRLRSE